MKTPYRLLLAALPLLLALSGCRKKEMFDPEAYHEMVRNSFPTSPIDPQHSWRLWSEGSVSATCYVEGAASLALLSKDPRQQEQAEVLGEIALPQDAQAGRAWVLHGIMPRTEEMFYVAAYDSVGTPLAVKEVHRGSGVVTLDNDDLLAEGATFHPTRRQRIYYLFESCFPQPGDWDYNDLVMTFDTPQPVKPSEDFSAELASRQVVLHVTLPAVGTLQQVAAAVRLVGVRPERVKSVTCANYNGLGLQRNTDYPPMLLTEEGMLIPNRKNSEAVLALFDDAHLAYNPERQQNAQPFRLFYNVMHDTQDERYRETEVPEADYVITFASAQEARDFSLSHLDPFIVVEYNGSKWEIHDYPDRTEQTLHSYGNQNEDNFNTGVSWALSVPSAGFRHAIEGQPLGANRGDNQPGAYPDFPTWIGDHSAALDWYLRPNESKVY